MYPSCFVQAQIFKTLAAMSGLLASECHQQVFKQNRQLRPTHGFTKPDRKQTSAHTNKRDTNKTKYGYTQTLMLQTSRERTSQRDCSYLLSPAVDPEVCKILTKLLWQRQGASNSCSLAAKLFREMSATLM